MKDLKIKAQEEEIKELKNNLEKAKMANIMVVDLFLNIFVEKIMALEVIEDFENEGIGTKKENKEKIVEVEAYNNIINKFKRNMGDEMFDKLILFMFKDNENIELLDAQLGTDILSARYTN